MKKLIAFVAVLLFVPSVALADKAAADAAKTDAQNAQSQVAAEFATVIYAAGQVQKAKGTWTIQQKQQYSMMYNAANQALSDGSRSQQAGDNLVGNGNLAYGNGEWDNAAASYVSASGSYASAEQSYCSAYAGYIACIAYWNSN